MAIYVKKEAISTGGYSLEECVSKMDAIQMELFEMAVETRVLKEHGLDYVLEAEDSKEGIVAKIKRKIKEFIEWIGWFFTSLKGKNKTDRAAAKSKVKEAADTAKKDANKTFDGDKNTLIFNKIISIYDNNNHGFDIPTTDTLYREFKNMSKEDLRKEVDYLKTQWHASDMKILFKSTPDDTLEDIIHNVVKIEPVEVYYYDETCRIIDDNTDIILNYIDYSAAVIEYIEKQVTKETKTVKMMIDSMTPGKEHIDNDIYMAIMDLLTYTSKSLISYTHIFSAITNRVRGMVRHNLEK